MALYKRESIERVRDAVDMVELVGTKSDLRRVGTRWVGLCPFHDERTASFSVNAQDKLFYCFGCQASGDAIGFVQQTEALDFRESVEFLAERYGIELELEREDPREEERRRRREKLLALLERAARFYATYLWEAAEAGKARAYLAERGFSEEVLREFRVGYSPSAWDRVSLSARRDGATPEELMAAGLAQSGRGGSSIYDRFRGRIMFPLADSRGRVLGFGARAMGEGRGPKYLNTSENELYHKGRQLFGLDLARAARGQGRPGDRGGGLHRRAGAAPGRRARGGGDHGHRADAGAAGGAGAHGAAGAAGARRRPLRAGGDAARRPRGGGPRGRAARGCDARGAGSGGARGEGRGGCHFFPRGACSVGARVSGRAGTCRCRPRYS